MEGKIELRNYIDSMNKEWKVEAGCEEPNATLTYLNTETDYDFLQVKGEKYSGEHGTKDPMPINVCSLSKMKCVIYSTAAITWRS